MKKRLLALMLVIAMLVSVAPAASALDIPDLSKMDITKVQTAIRTLSEYVNEELDETYGPALEASSGEYEVNSDSYYVALGDSTGTGMAAGENGENPEGYGNYGYKTVVPASFAYKLAEKLGLDIETQYVQLALAGMRTNDLRYVLDESFTPDEYTLDCTLSRINNHTGGLDVMRADYKAALAKADLVTLSIGSCNVSDFFSTQIKGRIASLLKSNDELMNILNGKMGESIKPMVDEYLDLDAVYYEMDWASYLDAEGMKYIEAVLAEVKDMLAEIGAPEVYTLDLGEFIQPMIDEQFGAGLITVSIPMDIPVHQLAADMVEYYLYGYITHAMSYAAIVEMIHEMSDAQLIVLSHYNSMDEMVVSFKDMEIPLGEFAGKLCNILSDCISGAAGYSEDTVFAPVFEVESNIDRKLRENGNVVDMTAYLSSLAGGIADFHATGAGQTYMAEQAYSVLTVTKSETEPVVNPFKDVTEKDYFFKPVMWAVENGVTTGTSATTFSPNDTVTRGQAVTFLWRAMGEPTPKTTKNPFTDVKETDYFYEAVLWAVENGITLGTSATTFSPKNTCSTAHIVTFIYRTLGIGTDGWYKEAAAWAEKEGLLTGTGSNVLPREDCPRANVVTFLYRASK